MNEPRIAVTLSKQVRNDLKAVLASEGSNISRWVREEALKKIANSRSPSEPLASNSR